MQVHLVSEDWNVSAQDTAMLQALYSRSPESVTTHIDKVRELGSAKFMEQYYLNYSHKSIGDCASTTVFVEGVSMAAAKAIQDTPLYNGQECSTRYIDYSSAKHVQPYPDDEQLCNLYNQVCKVSLDLYHLVYNAVTRKMQANLDKNGYDVSKGPVKNAIHAKACDFARGFLPIGTETQLSWTTTFRQFNDRLPILETHPLEEVRKIGRAIREQLHSMYPNSFKSEHYPEAVAFLFKNNHIINYLPKTIEVKQNFYKISGSADLFSSGSIAELLSSRPAKTEVPKFLNSLCRIEFMFSCDYGSFRDLQRHRPLNMKHTAPQGPLNIHSFYTDAFYTFMDKKEQDLAHKYLSSIESLIIEASQRYHVMKNWLKNNSEMPDAIVNSAGMQYFYPMGQIILCNAEMGLADAMYIVELRSTPAVHPTARLPVLELGKYLVEKILPSEQMLHVPEEVLMDTSIDYEGVFLERGLQTFKKDLE